MGFCNLPRIPVPQKIKDASTSYINDNNPVLGFLDEYYIFTNTDNDTIKTSDLLFAFNNKNRGNTITDKKLKTSNGAIGKGVKYTKVKGGNRVYQGLKEKPTLFDDDE